MNVLDMTIDREFELAYVYMGTGEVARTLSVGDSINIDIKESDEIFGVEFIGFSPLDRSGASLLSEQPDLTELEIESILLAQEKVRIHLDVSR